MIPAFTRKEYELLYSALQSYRVYMTKEQEVLGEKILDKVFYPSFDALAGKSDKELLAESDKEIKSLNFS